ncbi:radical SAM protein [Bradyrhizobium sp.]|uniref:radical SAM/SPASM domain-containing protein n=1 Tax=Bradyrhizobium sp. TaxID=376 RepID=UPI002D375B7F|nr:radical SAM protein [Bradyrhizobium sp.]HZR76051.1 radical SAM protein [Bradyrhizobium sp.]
MSPATDLFTIPGRAVRKAVRLAKKAVGIQSTAAPQPPVILAPSMRAFRRGSPAVESLPDLIYVEMAMACNFGCKMCPVPESRKLMDGRVPSIMKPDTFSLVLQSIRDRPRHLWLTQLGEPMLNKHLTDYVKAAKSSGHHVGFTTNGSMMTETKARDLLLAGVDHVVFSFDGATKKTFEKIRIGGNFDEVVANIKGFAAINQRLRPPENRCMVQVDMIVSDITEPEVDDFHAMWKGIAGLTQAIPIDDWAGQLDLPSDFGKPRTSRDEIKRYACDLLWNTAYVSAEGNAMMCCHDYKQRSKLPNVHDKLLEQIWRSDIEFERAKQVAGDFSSVSCTACTAWKTRPSPNTVVSV